MTWHEDFCCLVPADCMRLRDLFVGKEVLGAESLPFVLTSHDVSHDMMFFIS